MLIKFSLAPLSGGAYIENLHSKAQSAGVVEYTDYISSVR